MTGHLQGRHTPSQSPHLTQGKRLPTRHAPFRVGREGQAYRHRTEQTGDRLCSSNWI